MRHLKQLQAWDRVHRWTSLVCTLFLLLLCLTGLPLIFRQEIDAALQAPIRAPTHSDRAPASFDAVVAAAEARYPKARPLFASHEPNDDSIWYVTMQQPGVPRLEQAAVDATTAAVLGAPRMAGNGVMGVIRSLHVDLFAGRRGEWFLGAMGILFLVSLASGVVLYAPFLRHRPFGAVRAGGSARSAWLDRHNLLGIATLAWALVVGTTGCINTCADLLIAHWRMLALAQLHAASTMSAPVATAAPLSMAATVPMTVAVAAPLQKVLDRAAAEMHGAQVAFVAFPGTAFTDADHVGIYVRGRSVLRSRSLEAIFVSAHDAYRPPGMPWYMQALFLSEPLHFGNYGGWPLKLLWALYDVVTITVLGSGAYVWITRRPRRRSTANPTRSEFSSSH